MKRKAALTLIMGLLFSVVGRTQIFNLAAANPYWDGGDTTPPADMQTQTITITSPQNNTVYASNNLTLGFNVSLNSTTTWYNIYISSVYYKASWQNNSVSVYNWNYNKPMNPYDDDPVLTEFLYEGNLTEIPEGRQNITVTMYASGSYVEGIVRYRFGTNITSSAIFTVDAAPESFPTMPFTAGVGLVVVIGIGFIYFKKRKHSSK
jgi:hypothetical protein